MKWPAVLAAGVLASAALGAPGGSDVLPGRAADPARPGVALAQAAGRADSSPLGALGMQAYEPPKDAPAFALPDLQGRVRRLEDYRGKALLLFFWATW